MCGQRLKCEVQSCSSQSHNTENVSFHRFPKKKDDRLKKWLIACDMGAENIFPVSAVCSRHFEPKDYKIGTNGKKYLVKDSWPTKNLDDQKSFDLPQPNLIASSTELPSGIDYSMLDDLYVLEVKGHQL